MDNLLDKLVNPGKEYRPIPFWSWNDKLDNQEIKRQIREMKKAGMGGFFMHARGGLETEYLGSDWMSAIKTGIDEAEKENLDAWVYDEEGWPSGFAGGKVCALGDSYHGRWLKSEERPLTERERIALSQHDDPGLLGIFDIPTTAKETRRLTSISSTDENPYLVIRHQSNPSYVDVLSSKVIKKFIEFTHQAYLERFPEYFDGRMKGFFTDEPRFSGSDIDSDIPWSYELPDQFRKEYNLELIECLPSLFYETEDYLNIRYKFWKLVNSLFVHSFMKQIGEWCRQNNSRITGHIMMEETISTQMPNSGGVMPFYEFMDIPGIDWLRRTMSSPVVPKQVSSVAAQTGKKQILTESFALCGWNAGFEDLKWVAQWQYVNGVNLLCQHLQGYTIRGLRKRDYPPSLFVQQPWWDQYHLFNDYFARLGMILAEGRQDVDILVIHPMRSGWLLFDGKQNLTLNSLDRKLADLLEKLSGWHLEYHLGDETILERHGSVKDDYFIVGECEYKIVIIPELYCLSSVTYRFLELFCQNGGTVISLSEQVVREEGLDYTGNLTQLPGFQKVDIETLGDALSGIPTSVSLVDKSSGQEASDLQVTRRVLGDSIVWFIVNNSKSREWTIDAWFAASEELFLYDGVNHRLSSLASEVTKGGKQTELFFHPMESVIIISSAYQSVSHQNDNAGRRKNIFLPDKWNLKPDDLNVLTLDSCRYRIDGGNWENELPVIHLFQKLLDRKKSCRIDLEFSFENTMDSLESLNLVVERIEEFDILVNDKPLDLSVTDWWKDSSFRTVSIKDFVERGKNRILLSRDFFQREEVYHVLYGEDVYESELNKLTYDVELESIYITGDFGVYSKAAFENGGNESRVTEGPFYLAPYAQTTAGVNLIEEGLLFFSGKISLHCQFEVEKEPETAYWLTLARPAASMIDVLVNGKKSGSLLWAPWEIDLTDFLETGVNEITLIVYGSNRNMLGPHHHIDGEPFNVGPGSFTGKWSWVEKKSEAIPATKKECEKSYWNDSYAFVPYGLGDKNE